MNGPWKVYFETKGMDYMEFIQELSKKVEKCIWYFHPTGKRGPKPHLHALIYDFPRTDETMRGYIQKKFNLNGREQEFAVSNKYDKGIPMTEEFTPKYITYMTKGKYEPVLVKGYNMLDIDELKAKWVEPKSAIMNIEVVRTIKPKITVFAMSQMVLALYQQEGLPEEWDKEKDKELLKRCAAVCVECKYLPHYKRVIEIAQGVKFQMEPTHIIAIKKCLSMV